MFLASVKASSEVDCSRTTISLSGSFLQSLLGDKSRDVQLAALSLLTASPQATQPLTADSLTILRRNIGHLFANTDANFRTEVQSMLHLLIDRIKSVMFSVQRNQERIAKYVETAKPHVNLSVDNKNEFATILATHKDFVLWLLRFAACELGPSVSYQRHISALKCLEILLRSGLDASVSKIHLARQAKGQVHWTFSTSVFDRTNLRLLYDLLFDPFDDVRQGALTILKLNSNPGREHLSALAANRLHTNGISSEDDNLKHSVTLDRALQTMHRTGRMDHADGVARIYDLINHNQRFQGSIKIFEDASDHGFALYLIGTIDQSLHLANANMLEAVDKYPIHGLLIGLRYYFISVHSCTLLMTTDILFHRNTRLSHSSK